MRERSRPPHDASAARAMMSPPRSGSEGERGPDPAELRILGYVCLLLAFLQGAPLVFAWSSFENPWTRLGLGFSACLCSAIGILLIRPRGTRLRRLLVAVLWSPVVPNRESGGTPESPLGWLWAFGSVVLALIEALALLALLVGIFRS